MKRSEIPTKMFGQTDRQTTLVGLGGEGVLRTTGQVFQARKVILEALKQGITYFDSAQAYSDSELYYGSVWGDDPEKRQSIFQTSKSASRTRDGALTDLENTLRRMQTDYLDLWQIHDIRTEQDMQQIAAPDGALEAFVAARSSGIVRFIGVTAHHDPAILTKAILAWPVDAVLLPVNPVEGALGGFLTSALPAAKEKGLAIIAMKIMGSSYFLNISPGITAELLLRYALAQDITVAIVGCANPQEVQMLANTARAKTALSPRKCTGLVELLKPYARRLAYYRGVL